jgi:hypothetical protein
MLRRFLRWALRPLLRWAARFSRDTDPWERFPHEMRLETFGRGSWRPFPWYFEGDSAVEVASIQELCDWLLECEYVSDPDLFNDEDFWQHPRTFERLRQGDCEDHALWAWRKLTELGIEAELMSGRWRPPGDIEGGHVWVRFQKNGQEFILESVSHTREGMVRLLDQAKAEYEPHAGVDGRFQRFAYAGFLRSFDRAPRPVAHRSPRLPDEFVAP